jgi:AraC-like DNA-binding protein
MRCQSNRPSGILANYIANYHLREALVEEGRRVFFPARNDQFLEFYLGERSKVRSGSSPELVTAPKAVLVGIQSVGPTELLLSGTIRTFTIRFRPLGFHRLFRMPMDEIAGKGLGAAGVMGREVAALHDRLLNSKHFGEMVAHTERFLTPLADATASKEDYAFESISNLLSRPQTPSLDLLVNETCLSQRQFERRFKIGIGVNPKRFTRVARLHRALNLKNKRTTWTWGQVAAECGYHDQMHLVHDFQDLAGAAPAAFRRLMLELNLHQTSA